jgi:predicted nucleotidyltransferase
MNLEPDVEQAIRSLADCLRRNNIRFALIGARVVEITIDLKEANGKGYGFRGTADVDFTVRVGSWPEYQQVLEKLMGCGFHMEKGAPEHRLFFGDVPVDIIPYGEDLLSGDTLVWPQSKHEMNMTGFGILFDFAEEQAIGKGILAPVPPVPVSVFCKILAFLDRRFSRDLADAVYMLAHYEEVSVSERRFELYIPEDLPYEVRGAFLAGKDLSEMIASEDSALVTPIVEILQQPSDVVVNEAIRASRINQADFMGLLRAFLAGLGLPSD